MHGFHGRRVLNTIMTETRVIPATNSPLGGVQVKYDFEYNGSDEVAILWGVMRHSMGD